MNSVENFDKASVKQDKTQLVQALQQCGATLTHGRRLRCPFHDDAHPSAEIRQAASGGWYFYCFVCQIADDVFAIRARAEGRSVGEILKEDHPMQKEAHPQSKPTPKAPNPRFATIEELIFSYNSNPSVVIEEKNPYTDPKVGEAQFYTFRMKMAGDQKKTFRQAAKIDGWWQWAGYPGKAPLFNLLRVAKCDKVLIVEGEKCVREFTKLGVEGVAATTSAGGAINALKSDWSPLAGKDCYIWRDYDEPGLQYETEVISELKKLDCRIFRIRTEELDLRPKDDLADYLDSCEGTNADKVHAVGLVMMDAEALSPASALSDRVEKIVRGDFRAVPFLQKPMLSALSKALMPGTLTTICGDPGAGKSFFVLEDAWRWVKAGEKVKILMLEDDDAFHQGRAVAQMSGHADFVDVDFVAENGEWARSLLEMYRGQLEKFAPHLETTNSQQLTLDQIAAWIKNHAEAGVRIIIVDPITAAKVSDKPWIDDQKFLFTVKNVLESTGASLILNTHPRLGQAGKPSLSGMSGGASYPRFSQCVLWLRNLDRAQESVLANISGSAWHKQVLEIRKSRNGKGQGRHIALNLNFQNLCFDELGVIDQTAEKKK